MTDMTSIEGLKKFARSFSRISINQNKDTGEPFAADDILILGARQPYLSKNGVSCRIPSLRDQRVNVLRPSMVHALADATKDKDYCSPIDLRKILSVGPHGITNIAQLANLMMVSMLQHVSCFMKLSCELAFENSDFDACNDMFCCFDVRGNANNREAVYRQRMQAHLATITTAIRFLCPIYRNKDAQDAVQTHFGTFVMTLCDLSICLDAHSKQEILDEAYCQKLMKTLNSICDHQPCVDLDITEYDIALAPTPRIQRSDDLLRGEVLVLFANYLAGNESNRQVLVNLFIRNIQLTYALCTFCIKRPESYFFFLRNFSFGWHDKIHFDNHHSDPENCPVSYPEMQGGGVDVCVECALKARLQFCALDMYFLHMKKAKNNTEDTALCAFLSPLYESHDHFAYLWRHLRCLRAELVILNELPTEERFLKHRYPESRVYAVETFIWDVMAQGMPHQVHDTMLATGVWKRAHDRDIMGPLMLDVVPCLVKVANRNGIPMSMNKLWPGGDKQKQSLLQAHRLSNLDDWGAPESLPECTQRLEAIFDVMLKLTTRGADQGTLPISWVQQIIHVFSQFLTARHLARFSTGPDGKPKLAKDKVGINVSNVQMLTIMANCIMLGEGQKIARHSGALQVFLNYSYMDKDQPLLREASVWGLRRSLDSKNKEGNINQKQVDKCIGGNYGGVVTEIQVPEGTRYEYDERTRRLKMVPLDGAMPIVNAPKSRGASRNASPNPPRSRNASPNVPRSRRGSPDQQLPRSRHGSPTLQAPRSRMASPANSVRSVAAPRSRKTSPAGKGPRGSTRDTASRSRNISVNQEYDN